MKRALPSRWHASQRGFAASSSPWRHVDTAAVPPAYVQPRILPIDETRYRRVWLPLAGVSIVYPREWFAYVKEEPLPVKGWPQPWSVVTNVFGKEDVKTRGFFDTGITSWVYDMTNAGDKTGKVADAMFENVWKTFTAGPGRSSISANTPFGHKDQGYPYGRSAAVRLLAPDGVTVIFVLDCFVVSPTILLVNQYEFLDGESIREDEEVMRYCKSHSLFAGAKATTLNN